MEWLGPAVREGLPFDVEEFFQTIEGRRCAEWLTHRKTLITRERHLSVFTATVETSPAIDT